MKYKAKRTGMYRSGAEKAVGEQLSQLGLPALYESAKLNYVQHRMYTPDFTIGKHHIEVKGWWPASDRAKLLAVIHSNPATKILVALETPSLTLSKKSKTTYAQWCAKHGIPWCSIPIPPETLSAWLKQPTFPAQAPSAIVQTVQPCIPMEATSALCVQGDLMPMAQHGNDQ